MDEELKARLDRIEGLLLRLLDQKGGSKLSDEDKGILAAMWDAMPAVSRQRSSKKQVADEWRKVPKSERPDLPQVMAAIKDWKRCDQWLRDGGQYIKGLHLLVKARFWDSAPEAQNIVGFGNRPARPQELRADDLREAGDLLKDIINQ